MADLELQCENRYLYKQAFNKYKDANEANIQTFKDSVDERFKVVPLINEDLQKKKEMLAEREDAY